MLLDQCSGAMSIIGGLREVGAISFRSSGYELEARFHHATVRTVLVAARSPTSSGSHAGSTHGICMVGSLAVAYFAQSARISRVCVLALRSGGARESRGSHDLHAAHESAEKIDICTVVPYE